MTASVLIVEDDERLRRLVAEELADAGFRVRGVRSADAALRQLSRDAADLVVSDLRLPGEDGLALLHRVRQLPHPPAFVMITAFGSIPQAVEALKAGADDFLTKPINLEHLVLAIRRALDTRRLRSEVDRFQELLGDRGFHGMIGRSAPMRHLYDQIRIVAAANGPVLITGESGTGKELVARALHAESPRAGKPFVAVNCAGVPRELLESEFFGHTANAFTGAGRGRAGLLVEADGGTLLLDEIVEMPMALQAKLLRVLQDGRVRPVGATRERRTDIRIVAATNRNLDRAVREKLVRQDLFYRLETFTLHVPPLRDREDDLERLAAHFLARFAAAAGRGIRGFSPAALDALRRQPFPGNVRELENAVERAVTFCDGPEITPSHLPERIRRRTAPAGRTRRPTAPAPFLTDGELPTLDEVERRYIRHVLEHTEGNKRRAATLLGIGRRTLYRRLDTT